MFASPEQSVQVQQDLFDFIEPFIDSNPFVLLGFIFVNNAVKSLLVIILGVLLGLPSVLFIFVNGYLIGSVIQIIHPQLGYHVLLAGLLPHGIIEIPAILLASGLGIHIGYTVLQHLAGQKSEVRVTLMNGLMIYVRLILPALLLASIIEVLVTPPLIELAATTIDFSV
jgi:stage II sporulation protein M